jgi:hypothetical protein
VRSNVEGGWVPMRVEEKPMIEEKPIAEKP